MGKSRTFVNGDLVTAAVVNAHMVLDVPAGVTTQMFAADLPLLDTTNYEIVAGSRAPRVTRQGLKVGVGGSFRCKTSNHLSGSFRRLFELPPNQGLRPSAMTVDLVYQDNNQLVVFVVQPDGGVSFVVVGGGASPVNSVVHFNVGWDMVA